MIRTFNPATGRYENDPLPVAKKPTYEQILARLIAVESQLKFLLMK